MAATRREGRLRPNASRFHCPVSAALVCLGVLLLSPARADAQQLFDFHSAFWMNLHHYLQALGRATTPLDEPLPADATTAEQAQWSSAVQFYTTRFGRRSLLFDKILLDAKQQLIAVESRDSLGDGGLTPEHRQMLQRVAAVYRRHRWPAHDATNQQFIEKLGSLVRQHGRAIADRLARSYDDTWPTEGFRVDVVRDAGPPGNAYTTTVPRPTHITLGADDRGLMSLELIFHEASHHWDQRLMASVEAAAARLGVRAPPDLWHAILFYNAGRIVADVLAEAGHRDYQLMMVEGGILARPGWHAAITKHWPLFLSGRISRDDAIASILRDLAP
jgi:hypothetical protein